jgi:hypothetical protein
MLVTRSRGPFDTKKEIFPAISQDSTFKAGKYGQFSTSGLNLLNFFSTLLFNQLHTFSCWNNVGYVAQ